MKDQYDEEVPTDLVLLDSDWLEFLTDVELNKIDRLSWYEAWRDGHQLKPVWCIWVSCVELQKCLDGLVDFYGPEEWDFDKNVVWMKIDQCLHRFGKEGGFYHA